MKRINKEDFQKLIKIAPLSYLVVYVDKEGFSVKGRFRKIQNGQNKQTIYTEYKNKYISWNEYFKNGNVNIWNTLHVTEDNFEKRNIDVENSAEYFINSVKKAKAYALTEIEYNECIPMLKPGLYVLYIEHQENN